MYDSSEDKKTTIEYAFDIRLLAIVLAKLLLCGELMEYDLFDTFTQHIAVPEPISFLPYKYCRVEF